MNDLEKPFFLTHLSDEGDSPIQYSFAKVKIIHMRIAQSIEKFEIYQKKVKKKHLKFFKALYSHFKLYSQNNFPI